MERSARVATDAALTSGSWPVGERYEVTDALDTFDVSQRGWLPLRGEPRLLEADGRPMVRDDRQLPIATTWVRLIRDVSRPGNPQHAWVPSARSGLGDELAELGTEDDATIIRWVQQHGFVGVRANPSEWQESIEEIRDVLGRIAQARSLVHAIRTMSGGALRSKAEELLNLPPGLFDRAKADPTQPMSGEQLAGAFGIEVPKGQRWPGAGAHIQAMYGLISLLDEPVHRLLGAGVTIAPTSDGMRIQPTLVGFGPLAAAYLQTLDEASWPTISYEGSVLAVMWRSPRRCARCGGPFRPKRRDQKWCTARCRWAASKARAR